MPRRKKTEQTTREVLRELMEPWDPQGSYPRVSLFVDLFILFCIVASSTIVILEYVYSQETSPRLHEIFRVLEIGFTVIFVVEYLIRWYASEKRGRYPFTAYALIDLLAILPTLLMLSTDMILLRTFRGVRILRTLRLLRLLRLGQLLRLLKLVRYGYLIYHGTIGFWTWFHAVNYQYRLRELGRLFLWVFVAWFVGANILYFTESSLDGPDGPFGAYWRSYWHIAIVLISGIEDKEPLSLLGRIEVTVLQIIGICIVGMLTGEIVAILMRKSQRVGRVAVKPPKGKLAQHILILGCNSHLDKVIRQVYAATKGQHYILVVCPEAEDLRVSDPKAYKRVFALAGDPVSLRILEDACVSTAVRVIILASDSKEEQAHLTDDRTLMEMVAVICNKRRIRMVVELRDPRSEIDALPMTERNVEIVRGRTYGEGLISQAALNPGVTQIYTQLMTFNNDSNELYTVPVAACWVGKSFAEVQLELLDLENDDVVLVGIDRSPPNQPNSRFVLNPVAGEEGCIGEELTIREGDNLVVLAYERPSFTEVDQEDLWSGKILTLS